jgi:nitrate reductase delta subunit
MTALLTHQDTCRQFAALLSYPTAALRQTAADCLEQLQRTCPAAAAKLQPFADFLAASDQARIEELFTATFDLQPLCHPYVGYQLCGESQQRTMFLIKLQEIYRQHDYRTGSELPDHLGELLRFIGITNDQNCRRELIEDGLLPALDKIIQAIDNPDHPYRGLLQALYSFLSERSAEKGAHS